MKKDLIKNLAQIQRYYKSPSSIHTVSTSTWLCCATWNQSTVFRTQKPRSLKHSLQHHHQRLLKRTIFARFRNNELTCMSLSLASVRWLYRCFFSTATAYIYRAFHGSLKQTSSHYCPYVLLKRGSLARKCIILFNHARWNCSPYQNLILAVPNLQV